jgi:uncharacterized protein YdeI (YjbR/CyaY-like superfamily)
MSVASPPKLRLADQGQWLAWLQEHHQAASGVWLEFAKKNAGISLLTHSEALETALCYGWIDGQTKSLDEHFWTQRFIPRKADSIWSQNNRQSALALIESGRMQPAGLAAIERAKANGRWDAAYAAPSRATIPPDLAAALRENPQAASFFTTLNGKNRYAILFRLQTAKKAETRAARLERFIAMLARGETLHEQ